MKDSFGEAINIRVFFNLSLRDNLFSTILTVGCVGYHPRLSFQLSYQPRLFATLGCRLVNGGLKVTWHIARYLFVTQSP